MFLCCIINSKMRPANYNNKMVFCWSRHFTAVRHVYFDYSDCTFCWSCYSYAHKCRSIIATVVWRHEKHYPCYKNMSSGQPSHHCLVSAFSIVLIFIHLWNFSWCKPRPAISQITCDIFKKMFQQQEKILFILLWFFSCPHIFMLDRRSYNEKRKICAFIM